MIDAEGYRQNVGIIVINPERQVLWARRANNDDSWQFPQGGINENETAEHAMYRELHEEVGLKPADVKILAVTSNWLKYQLPKKFMRLNSEPLCIGQKQKWFLLELCSSEDNICLDATDSPEFDAWCWVDYWYPIKHVIRFKQDVYQNALKEFSSLIFNP